MTVVERADLLLVRMPLQHSFQTSSHGKQVIEHILVRLETADGAVGWGECASPSNPYYGPENVDTCWLMLHDYLLPALLGRQWDEPAAAYATGDRVRGNHFARAALDIACWDLWSRARNESLATALGASTDKIEAGVSLGIEPSVDQLLEQVERFLDEGYRRIKLKIAPGWDLAALEAVRSRFGDVPLQVDANGGYRRADLAQLRELDRYDLLMIEQPFAPDDLLAHAELQRVLRTPICLDESIESHAVLETALQLDAARVINIKVSRLGGLAAARQVHDTCFAKGVPVWCGGMHEFGVGRAANVALAALPGFSLPSDISGSDKYFREDVVAPSITAASGWVRVPYDRPGLGHDVVSAVAERHCIRRATLTSADALRAGQPNDSPIPTTERTGHAHPHLR